MFKRNQKISPSINRNFGDDKIHASIRKIVFVHQQVDDNILQRENGLNYTFTIKDHVI